MIIAYDFKPSTIFIENSFLDTMVVLDLLLVTFGLLITLNKLIFSRLLKCKIPLSLCGKRLINQLSRGLVRKEM